MNLPGTFPGKRIRICGWILLLGLYSTGAMAFWTGIELELADNDSTWEFSGDTREARINKLSLRIEEKTATNLSVGATLGYLDMRVDAATPADTRKFDGNFIGLYLRQPIHLGQRLTFEGTLSYTYHSGDESGNSDDDQATYSWNETSLRFGLGFRFSNFRMTPFVAYTDVDGDISDDNGTDAFSLDEPQSQGLSFDYFVEDTAYIRLELIDGAENGGFLTFTRRY